MFLTTGKNVFSQRFIQRKNNALKDIWTLLRIFFAVFRHFFRLYILIKEIVAALIYCVQSVSCRCHVKIKDSNSRAGLFVVLDTHDSRLSCTAVY